MCFLEGRLYTVEEFSSDWFREWKLAVYSVTDQGTVKLLDSLFLEGNLGYPRADHQSGRIYIPSGYMGVHVVAYNGSKLCRVCTLRCVEDAISLVVVTSSLLYVIDYAIKCVVMVDVANDMVIARFISVSYRTREPMRQAHGASIYPQLGKATTPSATVLATGSDTDAGALTSGLNTATVNQNRNRQYSPFTWSRTDDQTLSVHSTLAGGMDEFQSGRLFPSFESPHIDEPQCPRGNRRATASSINPDRAFDKLQWVAQSAQSSNMHPVDVVERRYVDEAKEEGNIETVYGVMQGGDTGECESDSIIVASLAKGDTGPRSFYSSDSRLQTGHLALLGETVLVSWDVGGTIKLYLYQRRNSAYSKAIPSPTGLESVSSMTTDNHSRFLICDRSSRRVYVLDHGGHLTNVIPVPGGKEPQDCAVVEGQLWVGCSSGDIMVLSSEKKL